MKKTSVLAGLPILLGALATLHCDGDPAAPADAGAPTAPDGGPTAPPDYFSTEVDKPLVPATKIDLLFVVDNSSSMGNKQQILATSVNRVLRRFIQPAGAHAPVTDIHVGVISTSLGSLGGDVCRETNPRSFDHARLRNTKLNEATVVPGAEAGFLALGAAGSTTSLRSSGRRRTSSPGSDRPDAGTRHSSRACIGSSRSRTRPNRSPPTPSCARSTSASTTSSSPSERRVSGRTRRSWS